MCASLWKRRTAHAGLIDEMQDLDVELLRALLMTQHQAGQRGWPFFIIGAGLPHLPSVLAEARSYAERLFDYRTISKLPDSEAAKAIVEPARNHGADVDPDALVVLLKAAGGYPYFLQEYGRAVWEVALGPTLSGADADASIAIGLARLDAGFFQSRWNRATPSERRMLVAMADDGEGPSVSSDVARRMGISPRASARIGPA